MIITELFSRKVSMRTRKPNRKSTYQVRIRTHEFKPIVSVKDFKAVNKFHATTEALGFIVKRMRRHPRPTYLYIELYRKKGKSFKSVDPRINWAILEIFALALTKNTKAKKKTNT